VSPPGGDLAFPSSLLLALLAAFCSPHVANPRWATWLHEISPPPLPTPYLDPRLCKNACFAADRFASAALCSLQFATPPGFPRPTKIGHPPTPLSHPYVFSLPFSSLFFFLRSHVRRRPTLVVGDDDFCAGSPRSLPPPPLQAPVSFWILVLAKAPWSF